MRGHRVQHALGDTGEAPALEPHVVVEGEARELWGGTAVTGHDRISHHPVADALHGSRGARRAPTRAVHHPEEISP